MKRTPSDRERRRSIADAATLPRPAVVLYACIQQSQDAEPVMEELRKFAAARDWDVAAELCERRPIATPLDGRPYWAYAEELIRSRRAQGIVTQLRAMCGYYTEDRDRVNDLMAEHQVFILPTVLTATGAVPATAASVAR
ncbi:hypothetical protein [Streptomyces sp. RPT161]|uniref:hypothetical protein n=1 Tax=Streptomyces sp. RPT161 TaxID=3015993 RepID=UPI0022B8901D|nr:hypothetical protein [Streptomyces sp. RPT161]